MYSDHISLGVVRHAASDLTAIDIDGGRIQLAISQIGLAIVKHLFAIVLQKIIKNLL